MSTELRFSGPKLVTPRGNFDVRVSTETADRELAIARQLKAFPHEFVLPWVYQRVYSADPKEANSDDDDEEGEEEEEHEASTKMVYPGYSKTLFDVLLQYHDTFPRMSVARLVLAEAIHRQIGRALDMLEELGLEHRALSPLAIVTFPGRLALGQLQYVCRQGEEVKLQGHHAEFVPQFDNNLDAITADLRGEVDPEELTSLLDRNGIVRHSWQSSDTRVLEYDIPPGDSGSETADPREEQEEEEPEADNEQGGDEDEDDNLADKEELDDESSSDQLESEGGDLSEED